MADKLKLTVKQEKFAQGLFAGLSQREAYKQAYNTGNMSDNTIDVEASKLANDHKITIRVEQLTEELKERNMVTVEKVLSELAHIAFDDISNYLEYKTVKTLVGHDKENGDPVFDYRTIVNLKDSKTIDTRNIAEISTGPNGQFKFKQYCKDEALFKLGKHLGMFIDKQEITGKDGGPLEIKHSLLSDEELDKEIAELSQQIGGSK